MQQHNNLPPRQLKNAKRWVDLERGTTTYPGFDVVRPFDYGLYSDEQLNNEYFNALDAYSSQKYRGDLYTESLPPRHERTALSYSGRNAMSGVWGGPLQNGASTFNPNTIIECNSVEECFNNPKKAHRAQTTYTDIPDNIEMTYKKESSYLEEFIPRGAKIRGTVQEGRMLHR